MNRRPSERIENALKIVSVDIPSVYNFLYEPARFKVLYGGRAGGKDWNIIRAVLHLMLLYTHNIGDVNINSVSEFYKKMLGIKNDGLIVQSIKYPHSILCVREVQESISASIHKLIKEQIHVLSFDDKFIVKDEKIMRSDGWGEFQFAGLRRDTSGRVRSTEGVTIGIAVEAQKISKQSWIDFCPTIRKDNSEIWIDFNTEYEDDPTYADYVANPQPNSIIKHIDSFDIEWQKLPQPPRQKCREEWFVNCPGCLGEAIGQDGRPVPNCGGVRTKYVSMTTLLDRKSDYSRESDIFNNKWCGAPLGKGSKIYPKFNTDIHVKTFPPKDLKLSANFFMSCDPAQHYYPACLWGAWFKDGDIMITYIYREYPEYEDFNAPFCVIRKTTPFTGTIKDLAREFYRHDGSLDKGFTIRARFIDTRFAKGSGAGNYFSNSTEGIVGEFAKKDNGGIVFNCPDEKIIDAQGKRIQEDLSWNTFAEIGALNHPHLYIDPSCKNLIQTMQNHRLEEKREFEAQKYKDFSDALKILYAGISTLEWRDPIHKVKKLTLPTRSAGGADSWMGA